MKFFRSMTAVLYKDLLSEGRKREILNSLLFFSLIIIFLFSFALGAEPALLKKTAPGLLWLVVFFSAILALERSYQKEAEEGCLEHLILSSVSHRAVFLGKLLTNFIFIAVVQASVFFMMIVLFNLDWPKDFNALCGTFFLGNLGLATLGTFYAALLTQTRARQALLPLLLFPMLTPLLLASVYATQLSLEGNVFGQAAGWIELLFLFDAVFLPACLLVIDPLMEA